MDNELKTREWLYRQVKSLDELYKGLVVVSYPDTYYHEQKKSTISAQNIRIVENPVAEKYMRF